MKIFITGFSGVQFQLSILMKSQETFHRGENVSTETCYENLKTEKRWMSLMGHCRKGYFVNITPFLYFLCYFCEIMID